MKTVSYEILPTLTSHNIGNCILYLKSVIGHDGDTEFHWHNGIELTLVLEGSVEYIISGQKHSITKGNIAFVNTGVIHQAQQPDSAISQNEACVLIIPDTLLRELVPDIEKPYFWLPEDSSEYKIITTYMYQIAYYMTEQTPYQSLLVQKELLALIYQLFARCYHPVPYKVSDNNFAQKVIEYVNLHYTEQLSLEKTATFFGLQKNYFCRIFKKETGFSFHNYLSRIRLNAALTLLSTGNYTVLECALEAGYSSAKVFIEWCNKIYHCTPLEFCNKRKI